MWYLHWNRTHNIDALQHQSLSFMSSTLDKSATSVINKYSSNNQSVTLSRKVNLWKDVIHIFKHVYMVHTMQPRGKTQNPRYHQGQNQQFADRRSDSTRTMIVDKFYHFHHHRGSIVMFRTMNNYIFVQYTL